MSDIAQVLIAVANIVLLVYIFTYTRTKDNTDNLRNIRLQEQNINLQWFKELIVNPNLPGIFLFFDTINTISQRLLNGALTDKEKIDLIQEIKNEQSKLRKSFVDILRTADLELERKVKDNLDKMVDDITETIVDKGINLSHPPAFEREIAGRIIYSKNDLMSTLYNFKGLKNV